jgi:hypothetical protein
MTAIPGNVQGFVQCLFLNQSLGPGMWVLSYWPGLGYKPIPFNGVGEQTQTLLHVEWAPRGKEGSATSRVEVRCSGYTKTPDVHLPR